MIQTETAGRGVDVILDFVGAAYAEKHGACLAARGRQVLIGVLGGAQATREFRANAAKAAEPDRARDALTQRGKKRSS